MSSDTKSKITRRNNKSKKMDELSCRRKTNEQSDNSDNNFSSDSDSDEMDAIEYQKFLSTMFPSKHLSKKIKAGEKLKKCLEEEESFEDSDSDSEYIPPKKSKQIKKKQNKKRIIESSDEEEEEIEETDSDSDYVPPKKSKQTKKKQNRKKIVESSSNEEEEEEEIVKPKGKKGKKNKNVSDSENEEEDENTSDTEESSDEDEINTKKSNKYNIIFTIGGVEDDEDIWETDEDEDDESETEETEDEDEEIISEEEESETEDEKPKKKNKDTKKETSTPISEKNKFNKTDLHDNSKNEELLTELTELKKKHSTNQTVQKCIELCEEEIKKAKKLKEKKDKKYKDKNSRIFKKIIKDKNTTNDFSFFNKLEIEEQKKIIKELKEINKLVRIEKPYRLSLLESNIPINLKAAAMKKINSLRYIEPGAGEFYKIKNWVDTFMRMPFDKYLTLPITIEDGVDKCHDFMANAQKTLDEAVYGLNDAKMQIMQMLGQLITNPKAIGTAIAIHGPPGTGKTSLVKEGISKILNRPFAFIALGGATDSSFLEGHSYTYEGSTWGKIVQILIDSKCMNPVIYFDELDKISDTPKGEEIAGILTHLTDTTQNSQFHDKYFAEIDFDLSKCLFIFSYNDETKINPILKDRMYRIQTKGYNQKQKTNISNNYLLPKIREQVKFNSTEIIIPDSTIHYIIENLCNKEDGVRNLKRCLEIIYTKLNLYRLMKPGSNLFEEDMSLKVEFPFTVTKDIVDKLIKKDKESTSLYGLYV
jgi:ATP-dependent Lon protease